MQPQENLNKQLAKIREEAEEREAERRAAEFGIEYANVASLPVKLDALKLLTEEEARAAGIAAFEVKKPQVAIAILDPANEKARAAIEAFKAQGLTVKLFAASRRGLEHLWSFYKFAGGERAPITSRVNIERDRISSLMQSVKTLGDATRITEAFDREKSSVTEFLEIVLAGALKLASSDIHFEPSEERLKLRLRIDGILHDISAKLPLDLYPSVVSRIKLLSNLKLNIHDRPQDGRFTIGFGVKDIEVRVALAPSEFGEIIVMRVLDPDVINLSLQDLGMREDDLKILQVEATRPHGMVLNTGPTGSGKTTTLYAILKSRQSPEVKIITLEDPIEYHLPGIEQTQVNTQSGYSFATGLRTIVRQDPDMILVGEIRDKDTAEIAVQAALTGHLVFSTVHANEAAGAIPRFLDLGVKPTSLGPAINLIIGQRLVRRLCAQCRKPAEIDPEMKQKISGFLSGLPERVSKTAYESPTLYTAAGCEACGSTGFKGRVGIFELLLNDPEYEKAVADKAHRALSSEKGLEDLIGKSAGEREVQEFALAHGMVTMQEDGILKILAGVTTLEEVADATGTIQWERKH